MERIRKALEYTTGICISVISAYWFSQTGDLFYAHLSFGAFLWAFMVPDLNVWRARFQSLTNELDKVDVDWHPPGVGWKELLLLDEAWIALVWIPATFGLFASSIIWMAYGGNDAVALLGMAIGIISGLKVIVRNQKKKQVTFFLNAIGYENVERTEYTKYKISLED